ncbi:MAG TPA: glycolate oxidase subunit GlcD [Desulfobacteraceae bacterium]|nr:glycolate oxidase subunit GlcD [Desulfobacteraceae bacterium]|tara:strand:- start:204 stop:1586 length:1383 start_codon:yes stop_codon:yes gene_type:complete
MVPISYQHLSELQNILGPKGLTTDKEERLLYSYDAAGRSFMPDAIVFPESETQVSQVMALANTHGFPVVPRGAGSGMTGGSVPVQGGIVLVMTRMNRILEIDGQNFTAVVEPGVVVADLHRAVEEKGLFYPPDPASSAVCTIGGNIGECAGGPRAVKYGVTRDYVLGLRAVVPTGEVISTGVSTAKGVAGYDLTRLIVGSEGTLAVATRIVLRLLPKPAAVKTMAVFFDRMSLAARTVSEVMKQAVVPRCVEYLDHPSLELVRDKLSFELPDGTTALLILELDGSQDAVEKDAAAIEAFCGDQGALAVITAKDQAEAAVLWQARKSLSPVLYKIAPHKINEDIVVPISKIPEMVDAIGDIQRRSGLTVVSFGHAGDGNIHCNIMYNRQDSDQTLRAHKAVDELFEKTLALGGTITGEHGVGITKMKYLPQEVGATELALMKGIKKVFDPGSILNPGKIFS